MQSGEVLNGRFEVEHLAGAGGMGEVHRGRDRETGQAVAIKVIHRRGDLRRFEREATVLASLQHPGIVRYVGHGADEQRAYLVMEWLEGESLAARLARARLTLAESVALAARVAEALVPAHAAGVIHRDLKPSNIFLIEGSLDQVKIIDFGLARADDPSTPPITASGATLGTPGYMSPEQVQRPREVDHRADTFSLGCVLFRCVTGRPPYEGGNPMADLLAAATADAPRANTVVDGVPEALDDLLARLLSRDPDGRPEDVTGELRRVEALIREQRIGWNVPASKRTESQAVGPTVVTLPADAAKGGWRPTPTGQSVDPRGSTEMETPKAPPVAAAPEPKALPARAAMHPATASLLTILAVLVVFGACGSSCLYCTCVAPSGNRQPAATTPKDAGAAPKARPTASAPKKR